MKKTIKTLVLLSAGMMLAGCVEDGVYSNDYYSSSGSYPYQDKASSKHSHSKRNRNNGYSSSGNAPSNVGYTEPSRPSYNGGSRPAGNPNGGYSSSSGQSVAMPQPAPRSEPRPASVENGYSSHPGNAEPTPAPTPAPIAAPTPADGGYSSNPGNAMPAAQPISAPEPEPITSAPVTPVPVSDAGNGGYGSSSN